MEVRQVTGDPFEKHAERTRRSAFQFLKYTCIMALVVYVTVHYFSWWSIPIIATLSLLTSAWLFLRLRVVPEEE